jgi:iron complex outermembrane receptor protein
MSFRGPNPRRDSFRRARKILRRAVLLTLTAGLVGKGRRLTATLNQTTPTFLDSYFLVNAAITYRHGPLEFSVFANNLFQENYFESYIEKTTLQLAGVPASDLGIVGDRRRIGARVRFQF